MDELAESLKECTDVLNSLNSQLETKIADLIPITKKMETRKRQWQLSDQLKQAKEREVVCGLIDEAMSILRNRLAIVNGLVDEERHLAKMRASEELAPEWMLKEVHHYMALSRPYMKAT